MDFHTTVKESIAALERDFPGQIDQDVIDAVIADARRQRDEAFFEAWREVFVQIGAGLKRVWTWLGASIPAHTSRLSH